MIGGSDHRYQDSGQTIGITPKRLEKKMGLTHIHIYFRRITRSIRVSPFFMGEKIRWGLGLISYLWHVT